LLEKRTLLDVQITTKLMDFLRPGIKTPCECMEDQTVIVRMGVVPNFLFAFWGSEARNHADPPSPGQCPNLKSTYVPWQVFCAT
jgi:hypothetical protein